MRLITKVFLSFIFLLLSSLSLFAEPIAVVTSDKVSYFQDVVSGVKEVLTAALPQHSIEVISSDSSDYIDTLKSKKYFAICVIGAGVLKVAKTLPDTPVIFSMVPESATGDLAQLCSKSDRNITGVYLSAEPADQVGIIKKIFPGVNRIYAMHDGVSAVICDQLGSSSSGVSLVSSKVSGPTDIPAAISNIGAKEHDIFVLLADPTIYNPDSMAYVLKYNTERHIITVGYAVNVAKAGALVGYVYDYTDIGKQTAAIIEKIAAGTTPAQIAPQRCRKLGYALNLKIANSLDIKIDPAVLQGASELIK